ncbi:MAG: hypothetical protein H7Y04_07800, partial [Verrucomicrobia bacterium]|nr:hypothetical protein [Cytophagales bacterium]
FRIVTAEQQFSVLQAFDTFEQEHTRASRNHVYTPQSRRKFIGIAIKTGSDTLSLPQQIFLKVLKQAGGIALLVGSVDEFLGVMPYELQPELVLDLLRK